MVTKQIIVYFESTEREKERSESESQREREENRGSKYKSLAKLSQSSLWPLFLSADKAKETNQIYPIKESKAPR